MSYIELGNKSDAYIGVKFSDYGGYNDCEDEEREDDASQIPG
jgi:hypothetical protein